MRARHRRRGIVCHAKVVVRAADEFDLNQRAEGASHLSSVHSIGEASMTGGEALYLTMVVAAFVFFAISLGWISHTEQRARIRNRAPASTSSEPPLHKAA